MQDQQNVSTVPCKYKVGRVLGQGTYAVVKGIISVWQCTDELEAIHIDTGKYYAAKVISKRLMAGREHMVRNEINVLRKISLGHEAILTLVDYFETVNSCNRCSRRRTDHSIPYHRFMSWRGIV
jgi:calcium/calmodulin-dependent protein kinase I